MKVSFIVPIYNAESILKNCIDSILKQEVDKEVILIDNNSTDQSVNIIKSYNNNEIVFLREETPGAAAARNKGLDCASGEYIAFIDADVVIPNENWVNNAIQILDKNIPDKVAGVGGVGKSIDENDISKALDSMLYGRKSDANVLVKNLATMNLVMRRDLIGKARFDVSLRRAQDPEFCFGFTDQGFRFLNSSELWVYHLHPTSFSGLLKRWYLYGLYYRQPYVKHPKQKDMGYYFRVLLSLVLPASLILSFLSLRLLFFPLSILTLLYLAYFVKLDTGQNIVNKIKYSFLHTLKQVSQLVGIFLSFCGHKI